jgi:hypothetical protein
VHHKTKNNNNKLLYATENIVNTRDKMILSNSPVFDFEALNSSTNLTKNTPNPCKKPVIST